MGQMPMDPGSYVRRTVESNASADENACRGELNQVQRDSLNESIDRIASQMGYTYTVPTTQIEGGIDLE